MDSTEPGLNYSRLNNLLWNYRNWFDRFEFLLEMQLLVAGTGRQDWQHHMAELLDEVADALGTLDLERALLLDDGPTLSELISSAPEVWSGILAEQQAALRSTASRVETLKARCEHAIDSGLAGVAQFLDSVVGRNVDDGYDNGGQRPQDHSPRHNSSILFDGRI